MDSTYVKILAVLLILAGESASIYAELMAAKNYTLSQQPFLFAFLKMLPFIFVAGGFLLAGYILGYKSFQNIWIVSAVSITSILVVEPFLDYTLFQQLPTKGALIGLILGVIGFIITLVY